MRVLFTILSCFIFLSCEDFFETTLDLDAPPHEAQLALTGSIDRFGIRSEFYFTRSVDILSDPDTVDMSQSTLFLTYPDGQRYIATNPNATLSRGLVQPFYFEDLPQMEEDGPYLFEGSSPGYENVIAEVTMAPEVELDTLTYINNGGVTLFGDSRSAIRIKFTDPPGPNYYKAVVLVNLDRQQSNFIYSTYTSSNQRGFSESGESNYALISDAEFDGEEVTIDLQFFPHDTSSNTFLLEWITLTEDQYQYDKILRQYEINQFNPFSAPIELPSNVENGAGFVVVEQRKIYNVRF